MGVERNRGKIIAGERTEIKKTHLAYDASGSLHNLRWWKGSLVFVQVWLGMSMRNAKIAGTGKDSKGSIYTAGQPHSPRPPWLPDQHKFLA